MVLGWEIQKYMQGVWKIPEPIEEGVGGKKISEPICIVEVG